MPLQALELLAFVVGAVALYALVQYGRKARYRPLPGPPGYPIIGNMFDIPREAPWMTYKQWSHDYGSDIVFLKLMGTTLTVLNSADVAVQLLEKRSNVYSDRPRSVMLHDLAGWERNLAFQAYGDDWRAGRRTFHQYFNEKTVKDYKPQTLKYPRRLLLRLLDSPEDFLNHVRWMTGSSIMEITYGFEIQDEKDPFLILAEDAAQSVIQSGNAGSYLVDIFPLLKHIPPWFPGAQFHRQATQWRKAIIAGVETPMKAVKEAMAAGLANISVTSNLLSEAGDPQAGEEYDFIEGVMGTAFVAGQDTTASTFLWFCFAMLKHPNIQRAAQEELDRVIGNDRLPELEDRDSLPFIEAILWEVLRWHPVTPLGIPHKLMTDDVYEGHHIPAGSVVVCNIWAISHDERVYPDPERFDPNRFLSPDSKLEKLREGVFGVGRRICPGRHLALQTLWLAMAHILAVFNIERPVDEHGNVIEPQFRFSTGVVSYPAPFRAKFVPRSGAAEQLIRNVAIGDWNAPALAA